MKPIGEIRQLRLKQFVTQSGMTFAEINSRLGRNRRDATLSQIAQAAPNTTTGKPRRMGDSQARLLESTFGLPTGWFDSDPGNHPDLIAVSAQSGHFVVREISDLLKPPELAAEAPATYLVNGWPFQTVKLADVQAMSQPDRATLERVMLAFMGSATAGQLDWRTTALHRAAELDKLHRTNNFTLFVRAIETDLSQARSTQSAMKDAAA